MGDVLIGIDLGTTVLKASAFDATTGRQLAESAKRLSVLVDNTGRRELPVAQVDRSLKEAFKELRKKLGSRWNKVAGIGLAAQGGSCILCDKATGRARSPMILWNDMRFRSRFEDVKKLKPRSYWRKLACRNEPGWGLGRILWLRDTNPQWLNGDVIYAGAGDYLYHSLTAQWRQDAGNALQIGCYNVPRRQLDKSPLALIEATSDFVSPMREGNQTYPLTASAAKLLGIPVGIPVAGPYMDHEAGYLAATGGSPGTLQLSLGTAWVGNLGMPRQAQWSSPFQLVLPSPADDGWMVCQPLLTGNVTWDWAVGTFVSRSAGALARANQLLGRHPLPPYGLTALPWFNMPNPLYSTLGAGSIIGMNASTGPADLLRAVAAGMTMELRRVFGEPLESGIIRRVVVSGGASRSSGILRLISAAMSPAELYVVDDQSSIGTRGALASLSSAVGRCASKPIPRGESLQREFNQHYAVYENAFARIYGDVSAGGSIHLKKKGGRQ